jgi:hypothetical protein
VELFSTSFLHLHGTVLDKARGNLYLLRYFYFIYSSFFFYILSVFLSLYPEDGDNWLPQNSITYLPICTSHPRILKVKLKVKIQPRTGHEAQRWSRGIDLDEVGRHRQSPAILHAGKRSGTHCTGGWVGPRACLDVCGKPRPNRDFIPRLSSS